MTRATSAPSSRRTLVRCPAYCQLQYFVQRNSKANLFMTRQVQLLLVHGPLCRFSGDLHARIQTQSYVLRMAVLLVMDGPP